MKNSKLIKLFSLISSRRLKTPYSLAEVFNHACFNK